MRYPPLEALFRWTRRAFSLRIEPVGDAEGRPSASAASSFTPLEVAELVALASGLPPTWCVTVEPPHGQIVISPVTETRWHFRCLAVANDGRHGPISRR